MYAVTEADDTAVRDFYLRASDPERIEMSDPPEGDKTMGKGRTDPTTARLARSSSNDNQACGWQFDEDSAAINADHPDRIQAEAPKPDSLPPTKASVSFWRTLWQRWRGGGAPT
jgi:hypothetical protein